MLCFNVNFIKSSRYNLLQQIMLTLKLFTLFLLASLSLQKITLAQLSTMRKDDLSSGDLIEVVEHADSRSIDTLSRDYYTLKVIHKQKRKAYDHMNRLFEVVVKILKKNKVIPHQSSLVQSKIKPQYLSKKRKWSFSMIFVIFGNQNELTRCSAELYKYGIQRLVTKPSINFLNQKMLALEVFSSAKARLEQQLSRFTGFKIKEVQEIQIEGRQIINSEILQNQIQQQFSQSEQQIVEEEKLKEKNSNKEKEPLSIRVVFRVGQEQEQQSQDFYEQIEQQNSQNSQDNSEDESI